MDPRPHRYAQVRIAPRTPLPPPRKKRGGKILRGAIIMIGGVVLTTLAINASDTFSTPDHALLAGVGGSRAGVHCPDDMVYVPQSSGGYCIDRYENSAGAKCAHADPQNQFETEDNIGNTLCVPVSLSSKAPWVNVPEHQALSLCARTGKRLPTNREWYDAALGTPDQYDENTPGGCAIGIIGRTHAESTGVRPRCISSYGAFDMVGNVWEWVDGTVYVGMLDNHPLPDEGYVSGVDAEGVPTETGTTSDRSFGNDYFFIDKSGTKGMFRGGFWSMGEKAGIYTVNATIPTSFVGSAVGFRCAKAAQ